MQSAGCRLCRIARDARGESTDGLAAETHDQINREGCEGMATTVTAAHHSIWRHLFDSMHAAQKPKSKLKVVTLDKESNLSTLWRREEFLRIGRMKDLVEMSQDIEVTTPVKKIRRHRTTLIQWLSSQIVSGAGHCMGSQSMRLCRSYIFWKLSSQQKYTRGSQRLKKQSTKVSSEHSEQLL